MPSEHCGCTLRVRLGGPAPLTLPRRRQISLLYDMFYHNVDHLVRHWAAVPRLCLHHTLTQPCAQHVWATRRDNSYLRYLALHFTVHGAWNRLE